MTRKFAGRGATQSGQRFLDSSVPRLIRHAGSCESAGGEGPFPSAGKDQKLSWGAGRSPAKPAPPPPFSRRTKFAGQQIPTLPIFPFKGTHGVRPCHELSQTTFPARIHELIAASLASPFGYIRKASRTAYTTIAGNSGTIADTANQSPPPEGDHQDGVEGVSCRPCLIACNSRKFTCQPKTRKNSNDR